MVPIVMHGSDEDRSAASTRELVRTRSSMDCVSTASEAAIPKLAMAPMPKVPTTPADRASGVFFPLEPARQ